MEEIEQNSKPKKQTFEDIIYGEEPTEEYLEEFNAITNSSISDEDVERQAMAFKPEEPLEPIDSLAKEPSYKTSEMSFFSWFMIILLLAIIVEVYFRFLIKS
ncbi:MAG TPA: hypothetical protein VK949_09320 [Methylotenera sp.]|nr:hypothetical protein [Methylotenera sp.]